MVGPGEYIISARAAGYGVQETCELDIMAGEHLWRICVPGLELFSERLCAIAQYYELPDEHQFCR